MCMTERERERERESEHVAKLAGAQESLMLYNLAWFLVTWKEVCACVCVRFCHRVTKPTPRGRNEEQGNAVKEINVFYSKEPSLWRHAPSLFSSRLIKKAIPPSPELPHS